MRSRLTPLALIAGLAFTALAASQAAAICNCPANVDVECKPVVASTLTYSNKADDTKDKLSFSFKGAQGPSTFNGLGNPGGSDSVCLCLYDNGTLTKLAEVPNAGLCDGDPCWTSKPDKAWKYKDPTRSNYGVSNVALTLKAADPSSGAKLKAKGTGVVDLALPLTGPVVVQLRTGLEYCAGAEAQVVAQDAATGKLKLKQKLDGPYPACDDGLENGYEQGVDCGGSCVPCPTCSDSVQNGDETGIDCGGSCGACPTCADGMQNGDETGVDCGGSCAACPVAPTCRDGVQNGDETGVDCGAAGCPLCVTGQSKRIFVGLRYAGWQISNLAQLDTHCTELAQAYDSNAGDFFAWACTGADDDPDSRFTKYSDPYVRFSDGVVLASGGWNQLTSGAGLDNAVLKDESGAVSLDSWAWTGTRTDGTCGPGDTPAPPNCLGWTTDSSSELGGVGIIASSSTDLWNAWSAHSCDGYYPIYCVEQ